MSGEANEDTPSFRLEVRAESFADATRGAEELEEQLERASAPASIRREPASPDTMDPGTILTILLTTAGGVALAGGLSDGIRLVADGIRAWLQKRPNAKAVIDTPRGRVELQWDGSKPVDVEGVVKAALEHRQR